MMKKNLYSMICLCSLVSMMLCACEKQQIGTAAEGTATIEASEKSAETVTFQATVAELTGSGILVEPIEGSWELSSANLFWIPNIENIDLHLGDTVEIEYDGEIMETDPAQLGKVYSIKITKETEDSQSQEEPSVVKIYEPSEPVKEGAECDDLVIMVKHYEMSDGTWKTDTHTYQYRFEITGRMGDNADKDSTFVFLSNIEDITFDQAWKASGFSSNMDDYFDEKDAKFVGMK